MIGSLDITKIEEVWETYLEGRHRRSAYKRDVGWLGKQAGPLLQEIRILRTQVEGLQVSLKEERQKRQEENFDHMMDREW